MIPARQHLYQVWHQPGHIIDPAWWGALGLHCWQSIYRDGPLARPALDTLLRQRLGQSGAPPTLTPLSSDLLASAERRTMLLLAMGLWALEAGGLLLLKPYRETLADTLDPLSIGQLQVLLPYGAAPQPLPPASLYQRAMDLGIAWLSQAPDPALRACRLYSPHRRAQHPRDRPSPYCKSWRGGYEQSAASSVYDPARRLTEPGISHGTQPARAGRDAVRYRRIAAPGRRASLCDTGRSR
ncbi:hypothetical protein MAY91_11475 [Edwardsiella ictaluri]|uniref:Uncharacterized protein n=1 Tax=Edwardsiella ictaluri TaxID=67780 RepID=A0ABY8GDI2_EDWIC|nr:type III secretion system domain-containing protein [Edwardsiella ictaluri]WFN95562.1 hypothetical protein MAY91_11475 [Edwardsiella ictaluri]